MSQNGPWRVAVIGGGPAGAQCALWLTKLGVSTVLIEKAQLGGLQASSPYTNSWLSVVQATIMARDVAANIKDNLIAQGCEILRGEVLGLAQNGRGFSLKNQNGEIQVAFVVLATGTRERRLPGADLGSYVLGLVGLSTFLPKGRRVAILGGGDAACEAYQIVQSEASEAKVFARNVRANAGMWAAIPESAKVQGEYSVKGKCVDFAGQSERFDDLIVCYGWEPVLPPLGFEIEQRSDGYVLVDETMRSSVPGLYAIGDVNHRPYPCVSTAMADGVYAAKSIEALVS